MRISDWSSDVCSSDLSSGRPVLIVPDGYKAKAIEHVAIGWNATRESTHSLRDATAFASPGAKIDILVLDAKPTVKGHGSEPGADITQIGQASGRERGGQDV